MISRNCEAVERIKIESLEYKGKTVGVTDVTVQWLSKAGTDPQGAPAYGLRLFTIGPGGHIPTHSHAYVQTMYILSGRFECWEADPDSDEIGDRSVVGPGDTVYVPTMEPHGMRNISDTEAGTFLCCIGNVTDEDDASQTCS